MALNLDGLPSDPGQFSAYLSELTDEQLEKLEPALVDHFRTVKTATDDGREEGGMARLNIIATHLSALRSERNRRKELAVQTAAEAAAQAHRKAVAELDAIVAGQAQGEDEGEQEDPQTTAAVASMAGVFAAAIEKAVEKLSAQPALTASISSHAPNLNPHIRRMPLGDIARHAPNPKVLPKRSEAVLVASADIPGRARNGQIGGIGELVEFMGDRARMLPVTHGNPNYVPVAYLKRDFRYRLGLDSTPAEIDEVLVAATDPEALIAAGGWCAPSEISYDFYNLVCEDGMIDLPTVGVLNRGGFRFPTSPTIADIFATNALWSWTETQDVAAATGTGQSGVKTCARVICSSFNEERASCDGLCVTAGNLTDFAYPEAVENFIRTVMAARAHRTNQIIIQRLVNGSTAVNMTASDEGSTASILNSVELQAYDLRERYRMCDGALLEVILPRWAVGAIRGDLANRSGLALFNVTAAMIADWFDERGIRVQFVADYQSGFAGSPIGAPVVNALAWPATVEYLIYPPATWVRGQGLQLDLGVVRDSTLNTTNDHTAAWMEDCYAIARVGYESRRVTTAICTSGGTGANELTCLHT